MHPRKGWAGAGDRIPGLSRRSFIRATRASGWCAGQAIRIEMLRVPCP